MRKAPQTIDSNFIFPPFEVRDLLTKLKEGDEEVLNEKIKIYVPSKTQQVWETGMITQYEERSQKVRISQNDGFGRNEDEWYNIAEVIGWQFMCPVENGGMNADQISQCVRIKAFNTLLNNTSLDDEIKSAMKTIAENGISVAIARNNEENTNEQWSQGVVLLYQEVGKIVITGFMNHPEETTWNRKKTDLKTFIKWQQGHHIPS